MDNAKISVSRYGIQIILPAAYTPPEYYQPLRKQNAYGCSIRYLPEVLERHRGITAAEQLPDGLVKTLYDEEMRRRSVAGIIKTDEYDILCAETGLWEHQRRGVDIADYYSRYAYFYDTRTGKTRMAYQIMLNKLKAGTVKRCIVFTPSSIIPDWISDAEQFSELKVSAYYKDGKQKEKALTTPCHILLMSVELVVKNTALLERLKFDLCFFDESSRLKSHTTEISKFMLKYSQTIPYFYLLSATPAPNGHHEYYVQMRCIDQYMFPITRTKFVLQYFTNKSYNPTYEKLEIKPNMLNAFLQLLSEYSFYVDQSVMETAGKVFHEVPVQLSAETMRLYDDMRKHLSTEFAGESITVDMAAQMRGKLQQIASGFVINTDIRKEIATAKKLGDMSLAGASDVMKIPLGALPRLNAVKEITEKYPGQQFVIWANYRQEFEDLQEFLGFEAAVLNGGVSIDEKEKIVRRFKRGLIKYLICHPSSVGMGKNFTESHVAIYYSLNDSWEAFKQSSERIAGHITVQPELCHYYILLATGTINEVVYDNIKNKREKSTGTLEHLQLRRD